MPDTKVVNTDDLKVLIEHARRNRLNRCPALDGYEVDPNGNHLLSRVIYGHNMDRAHIPLHHRCRLYVKLVGTDQPFRVWLDVLDTDWNRLHDTATYLSKHRHGDPPARPDDEVLS